jgi:hypothetical protein
VCDVDPAGDHFRLVSKILERRRVLAQLRRKRDDARRTGEEPIRDRPIQRAEQPLAHDVHVVGHHVRNAHAPEQRRGFAPGIREVEVQEIGVQTPEQAPEARSHRRRRQAGQRRSTLHGHAAPALAAMSAAARLSHQYLYRPARLQARQVASEQAHVLLHAADVRWKQLTDQGDAAALHDSDSD